MDKVTETREQATAREIVVRRVWRSSLLAGEMSLSICGTTTAGELEDVLAILELAAKQIRRDYLGTVNP